MTKENAYEVLCEKEKRRIQNYMHSVSTTENFYIQKYNKILAEIRSRDNR